LRFVSANRERGQAALLSVVLLLIGAAALV
jgi:hypothetical protein